MRPGSTQVRLSLEARDVPWGGMTYPRIVILLGGETWIKAFDQTFTLVVMSDSHLSSLLLAPSYFIPDAFMKEIQQAVDH